MATQIVQSMVSEVTICNQALSWVGANKIGSLDEPGAEAEWCKNNYDFLRDAVLEERMWTFATVRASSTVADKDAWGQEFIHRLPEEWLAVYRVYSDTNARRQAPWQREGEFVRTPCATIYMWGLARITDTSKFSLMFVQALAARLAADMAIPLTEDRKLQADMWGLYQRKLAEAAARDGQQGRNEVIDKSQLVDARLNDGSRIGMR